MGSANDKLRTDDDLALEWYLVHDCSEYVCIAALIMMAISFLVAMSLMKAEKRRHGDKACDAWMLASSQLGGDLV